MKDFSYACRVIRETISSISNGVPGVYKMISAQNRVLYVGKARDLKNRLSSYLNAKGMSARVLIMVRQIAHIELAFTENETEALLLEAKLIKSLRPRYNIIMRDDKFHPYIYLSKHRYPRISLYREKRERIDVRSYGPFLSSAMTRHVIEAIKKAFLIRSCPDSFFASRNRPCIEYEMKNCSAPCTEKISVSDYAEAVHMAHKVLMGKSKEIQRDLLDLMQSHSDNLEYESAIVCRDRIHALKSMQECIAFFPGMGEEVDFFAVYKRKNLFCIQVVSFRDGVSYGSQPYFAENVDNARDFDVVSMCVLQMVDEFSSIVYMDFASNDDLNAVREALQKAAKQTIDIRYPKSGDERRAMSMARRYAMEALNSKVKDSSSHLELRELSKLFHLTKTPERIEVYDNSHISGHHPYGVMIVHGKDRFLKKEYRKFKIKSVTNGDDYSMMHEVICRRFSDVAEVPDFVLIDGGKGHISAVHGQLTSLGIPFACIAKGPDRIVGTETLYSSEGKKLPIGSDSRLMNFLCKLRDEAHRYAVTSHRKSRDNNIMPPYVLNNIPGIGKTRTKALLAYFGSVYAVKHARVGEICMVPGISPKLAERIVEYLKN
ncbi:MAG: excinuclease ABC subunit UvrC [Aaplasma endosymbiont of Hyalomma asiaticum]